MSAETGEDIHVHSEELSDKAQENLTKMKKALTSLNERRGESKNYVNYVIVNPNSKFNGAEKRGNIIYIAADTLERDGIDGYAGTLLHEVEHTNEIKTKDGHVRTEADMNLLSYLEKDAGISTAAAARVFGDDYGISQDEYTAIVQKKNSGEALTPEEIKKLNTFESEYGATLAQYSLGKEYVIERLVRKNATVVERMAEAVAKAKRRLSGERSEYSLAQRQRLNKALSLYLKAAKAAGKHDLALRIMAMRDEEAVTPTDSVVSWSLHRTRNMNWEQQIRGALKQTRDIRHSDTLTVGEPSIFLQEKGISAKPLAIPLSVITKAKSGKDASHSIQNRNLEKMQEGIQNAPIIIDNPARNALVYITNILQDGKPILVAFQKNVVFDGDDVHKATTIHLQWDVKSMVTALPKEATIYAKNKSEFEAAVGTKNNLLGYAAHIEFTDDSVSQNFEKVNSETKFSLKSSPDTVTMSKGEAQKRRANFDNDKVYDKKDIVNAFSEVKMFETLPRELREQYINDVWRGFNTFKDDQRLDMYKYHQIPTIK